MIIEQMINFTPPYTESQWSEIEVKFTTIEERVSMQIKNAIIDYISEQFDLEDTKKKPKPYYRKGRWD
jgi:hypothetical protein